MDFSNYTKKKISSLVGFCKSVRLKNLFDAALFIQSGKTSILLLGILIALIFSMVIINFFKEGSKSKSEKYFSGKEITSWRIEKDNVFTTVGDYFGDESGTVCLVGPEGKTIEETNVLNIVGDNVRGWHCSACSLPKRGTLCIVLDKRKNIVDILLDYNKEEVENALSFAEGKQRSSLKKSEKPVNFDKSFVFPICKKGDCVFKNDSPDYVHTNEIQLDDEEEVAVINILGEVKIYPISLLSIHQIVEDKVNLFPFAVTYDWLTNKITVFKRVINGEEVRLFPLSKVYNSSILLYDKNYNNWWVQFNGISVKGDLAGYKMDTLPYQRVKWKNIKDIKEGMVFNITVLIPNNEREKYVYEDRLFYPVNKEVSSPKKNVKFWGDNKVIKEFKGDLLFVEENCNLENWLFCKWYEPGISYSFAYELFN